jgi:hypothetical protein
MAVYMMFLYSNITYVGSYPGPTFLWALTRIYLRVPMPWALLGVPLLVAPKILSES